MSEFLSHDQNLLIETNRKPVDILSLNSIFKLIVLLSSRCVKIININIYIYIYIYIYVYIYRERERGKEHNISIVEMGIYNKFCRRGKLK